MKCSSTTKLTIFHFSIWEFNIFTYCQKWPEVCLHFEKGRKFREIEFFTSFFLVYSIHTEETKNSLDTGIIQFHEFLVENQLFVYIFRPVDFCFQTYYSMWMDQNQGRHAKILENHVWIRIADDFRRNILQYSIWKCQFAKRTWSWSILLSHRGKIPRFRIGKQIAPTSQFY